MSVVVGCIVCGKFGCAAHVTGSLGEYRTANLPMMPGGYTVTTTSNPGAPASDEFLTKAKALFKSGCTCGGVDIGVGVMHEPTCGVPTPETIAAALLAEYERGVQEPAACPHCKCPCTGCAICGIGELVTP